MSKEYKKLYKYSYNYGCISCEELEIKKEQDGKYWVRKGRFNGNTKGINIDELGKVKAGIGLNYKRLQYVVEERNDEEVKRLFLEAFEKYVKKTKEYIDKMLIDNKRAIERDIKFKKVEVKPPKKKVVIIDGGQGIERYEIGENEDIEKEINKKHIDLDDIIV